MARFSGGGAASGAVTGASTGAMFGPWGALAGGVLGGLGGGFLGGSEEAKQKKAAKKIRAQTTLRPEQEPLAQQLFNAGLNPGAGGAFGNAADYYYGNIGGTPEDYERYAAPELRNFNENIIPGISEQFAGMGAGGLSSSSFRNAAVGAGADLQERLAAMKADLRQRSAQGLMNIGQLGLGRYSENIRDMPQQGFMGGLAEGAGQSLPYLASMASDYFKNKGSATTPAPGAQSVGRNSSPYGGNSSGGGFQLPNFNTSRRGF